MMNVLQMRSGINDTVVTDDRIAKLEVMAKTKRRRAV
jgi:hypothetical protein